MVDTSKRSVDGAAAPTKAADPAAGLDAYLHAMRLDDAASSPGKQQQQQHRAAVAPSLLRRPQPPPQPLQVPVAPPTARADLLQKQFERVRQCWPQPQPQPSYAVREGSAAAAELYASILGPRSPSSFFNSHFGAHSPRHNTRSSSSFPSMMSPIAPSHAFVPPSPSSNVPSSSTNHYYQPTTASASSAWDHHRNVGFNPFASAPPVAMLHDNAGGSFDPYATDTHQPRVAMRHDNAGSCSSFDPYYVPAFPSEPHASNNSNQQEQEQVDRQVAEYYYYYNHPWMMGVPAVRHVPTLEEVRARLLRGPMDPALVAAFPEAAPHVVRLLQEGDAVARRSVLAGVTGAVHGVMGSREARDVFLALLRACQGRPDELRGVVGAVCAGKGVLMGILKHDHGVAALKGLIVAAAPYPELSGTLIVWLLHERLVEHCKCAELVHHCFATIPYETCLIMIRFATYHISEMLSSTTGSIYLAACFAHARNQELQLLEDVVLSRTSAISKGQYSNYFMQKVLECGSEALKERVAERVAADVASLSMDKFGSYVVEACFQLTCSLTPMRRVLAAFLALSTEQLAELVQGVYSNYVVHKLLAAGKKLCKEETLELARRIEELPESVHREMHAQRVMRVVKKQFPRSPRY